MPWNEPKTPFMQNLHNRHSRPKNPFKALLLDLERAYALPCGFHYCTPGADEDPGDDANAIETHSQQP